MRQLLAAAVLALCWVAGAHAAEEETRKLDRWSHYDDGEERGWSNTNKKGERVAIHACEAASNSGTYRFFFTGLFDRYSDDRKRQYRLSAGHEGRLGEVYAYTSKEYFDYVYNFSVDAKRASRELGLQFCVSPIGQGADGCAAFTGRNFRKVIDDLCGEVADAEPEVEDDEMAVLAPVEAFYLALEEGDGRAAAANVIPEKRRIGPLSAKALSDFYGNLKRPLRLISVALESRNKVRARYTFEPWEGKACNGASVSTITQIDGVNLIAGIKSETGC